MTSKERREKRKAAALAAQQGAAGEAVEGAELVQTATGADVTNNNEELPTVTTPEKPKKTVVEEKPKQILVDSEKLDNVLDRLEKQDKELEILRKSVNQNTYNMAKEAQSGKKNLRCYLKVYTDAEHNKHLIIGWKASPDNRIVYSPSDGRPVGEVLKAVFFFKDGGDSGEIDQVAFTRITDVAWFEIMEDKGKNFSLRAEDSATWGLEAFDLDKAFVNP